ncbi:MAG: TraB/GumN family protein [Saprospirales bacterium]|nr:TraB/GumN family protein [Saprospirales bacterium]MBK8922005.1 TraB/GumN family protein [Saprospirales bacterium]
MQKLWLWLVLGVAITGCRPAQPAVYAPGQFIPAEKALLWKISGNGLKKPSYLLGTIHLIPRDRFRLSDATFDALSDAQRVTFEIDMKEMTNLFTQFNLLTKAFMGGGKTLRDLLSPEDYAFVRQKLDTQGLPASMLERMKPLFLSTMLGSDEQSGLRANSNMTSVEMELYRHVKRRKLPSAGLETATYQMGIFDSIPYAAQAKMLVETLRDSEGSDSDFEQMINLYLQKDINAMEAMMDNTDSGMHQFQDILLHQRNRNWIPVMGRMMREKPTLFAVGAGHLGGGGGVIALLRKAGYRVEAAE